MTDSLMHTTCLLCGKHAVSVPWHLEGLPYKNYSYCSDCISKGIKLLKAQEQTPGEWVSVKDKMPDRSGTYLCYQPKVASICALNTVRWSEAKGYWMGKEVGSRIEGIEYWMPLPKPPKEDEDD